MVTNCYHYELYIYVSVEYEVETIWGKYKRKHKGAIPPKVCRSVCTHTVGVYVRCSYYAICIAVQ